ncbi:MAG: GTPase Era [Treponema sp.]|jgi:GTP-binding protein Era|nr:GTPase Era [Treponema sp.]
MGDTKAAFVAVVGRPSAGKSTLVNALCGEKVAIVSPVPQTTRNAIRGIVNRKEGQLVFVDTPGQHLSERKFNRKLADVAGRAQAEADLVLYVLDSTRPPGAEEEAVAARLRGDEGRILAAINKTDSRAARREAVEEFLRAQLPGLGQDRCFPVSALRNEGTEALLERLFSLVGPGDPFYPEEYYTDQDPAFRVAEIIREKAINRLRQELPHSLYVDVADAELRGNGTKLWVRAFIVTERESQKGMIVGKGGRMIKAIREEALADLKRIFDWKIELDLRVKVSPGWRHDDAALRKLLDR